MVPITKYHIFAGLILFLILLFATQILKEQASDDTFENITNETPEIIPDQIPLMSTVDDTSNEERKSGWWKHNGHSTVSYVDVTPGYGNELGNGNDSNEGNESNDDGSGGNNQEIPEFPLIALPIGIVLCISILFSRK